MSKRSHKIISRTPREIAVRISSDDWQKIELAYGHSLSTDVRAAVVESIKHYLSWDEVLMNAEPLSKAKKRLAVLHRAAVDFQRALNTDSEPAVGQFVNVAIESRLKTLPLPLLSSIAQLRGFVAAYELACEKALEPDFLLKMTLEAGEPWKGWIQWLTAIAEENSLPCGVSKEDGSSSKFVALVKELQKLLPPEYRRSNRVSDVSLAAAIIRARNYEPISTPTFSRRGRIKVHGAAK